MPTETFTSAHSCDDAFEKGDGTGYSYDDYDVVIQSYTNPGMQLYQCGGFRFPNIPIPKGSVATAAKFRGFVNRVTMKDANFKFYGNLVADAKDFCELQSIIGRPRTTAYVEFVHDDLPIDWIEITGLEGIINEILVYDWASGNAIALLAIANTDVAKGFEFRSWDYPGVTYTPELVISWLPPTENPLISKPLVSPIMASKPIIR